MHDSNEFRFERHRLYGQVRLKRVRAPGRDGKTYEWWEYDPTFTPPVPPHALLGNPLRQVFCAVHHIPKYFYVDEAKRCVDCGDEFLFEAAEQRFWYETLKFNLDSVAIRCRRCRRRKRNESALNNQVRTAREAVAKDPELPSGYLALAESLIRLHERTRRGSLNDAISAARKARALWPDNPEPSFWEGLAHIAAGRGSRGKALLESFLHDPLAKLLRRGALAREAAAVIHE